MTHAWRAKRPPPSLTRNHPWHHPGMQASLHTACPNSIWDWGPCYPSAAPPLDLQHRLRLKLFVAMPDRRGQSYLRPPDVEPRVVFHHSSQGSWTERHRPLSGQDDEPVHTSFARHTSSGMALPHHHGSLGHIEELRRAGRRFLRDIRQRTDRARMEARRPHRRLPLAVLNPSDHPRPDAVACPEKA